MLYRFYIFLIFFFSIFFSTATYSQSSKLNPTFFVLSFWPIFRILILFILVICFSLLGFSALTRQSLNFPWFFSYFLLFQTLCLLLVSAQQNFIPRFFTDPIYLLPLPIFLLGLSNFKRFTSAALIVLLIVSLYSFIQLPVFGLTGSLPILATEGWGSRVSGFLGINSHASFLVVLITTLDFNINTRYFPFRLFGCLNTSAYTMVMFISCITLLLTGSRAAILICSIIALSRRMPAFLAFLSRLRIRYIYIFLCASAFVSLLYIISLNYTQCYSCNYIIDFSRAASSLTPRVTQLHYLSDFISSPWTYLFGTTDLSSPDIVGDNPWLEYTLDYGLLFTISYLLSFVSLGLLLFKSFIYFKSQSTSYSHVYSQVSLSFLYGLSSIALLMLFYDSPQSAPTFLIYLVLCYSFISFYHDCFRSRNDSI